MLKLIKDPALDGLVFGVLLFVVGVGVIGGWIGLIGWLIEGK